MTPTEILAISLTPGAGNVFINRLIAWCGSAGVSLSSLLGGDERRLSHLLPSGTERWVPLLAGCTGAIQQRAVRLLATADMAHVQTLSIVDPAYPVQLKEALGLSAPPLLYLYGASQLLKRPMVGVVGTRWPSRAGVECAGACATSFARKGVPVVSGGAVGVDSEAHYTALSAGGFSVFVLPQGLLTYNLPREYGEAMAAKRVLLVSEFQPMAEWQTHAAVTRNATIAALSRILCVVEARKKGGSIQTAGIALKLQRPVLYRALNEETPVFAVNPLAQPLPAPDTPAFSQQLMLAWGAAPASVNRQLKLL